MKHYILNSISKLIVIFFLTGLLFCSCKVTQPFQISEVAPDKLYRDVNIQDSSNIATIPWKEVFTDSSLQALIEEGLKNNLDLQIAHFRIEQAAANFRQSRLALLPSLNANASATFQKQPITGTEIRAFGADLSSNWEIDLWGKLRSAKRAQLMAFKQSESYQRAVQTRLVANIASYYFNLLTLDAQLKITEQTIGIRKEDVESMKMLKESNIVTGAAVVQSEANRYSAEVTVPTLRRNIRETENTLSIILGRVPGSINRSTLESQNIAIELKTGIPAQLLANRPDVQEAEFQLRYFAELTNVARAYFYPSLSVTAQAGFTSSDISQVFNPSSFFGNIFGNLTQPLLNQGLNRQRLRVAKARQTEYLAIFKQSLLNAGQEVSDALFEYEMATEKINLRAQQISFLEKAVDYTKELLKYTSATNFTDVLTSEQSLLSAQLSSVDDKQEQLLAIIKLYRSLGGGTR